MRFTLEHVKNIINNHGDTLLSTEYQNYRQKLKIKCQQCENVYEQSFQMIQKDFWCTEDCWTENYKNRDNSHFRKKYSYEEVKKIIQEKGDKLCSNEYKSNQRCAKCYIETRKLTHETFKECVDQRGDTLLGQYIDSRTKIEIKCGTCKQVFNIKANGYRTGSGCQICGIVKRRLSYEEVKKRIESFGDKLLSTEYINNNSFLKIQCGNCNETFEKKLNGSYNPFCKFCNSTTIEKMMMYLSDNEIVFETQKMYKDCMSEHGNMFRFDFYLPTLNCIIEADGLQHFELVKKFKMKNHTPEEWFNVIQERDRLKTKYCIDNDIKLIRVSHQEMKDKEDFEEIMDRLLKEIKNKTLVYSNPELYSYLS